MGDHQPSLVTTCTFKGREYLIKLSVINGNSLDLSVTDKFTAEEWNCNYDASYIENQTHKTGNFKQFDIFITMLKSGLLKTSDCVSLDLLTFDDLELLRSRRTVSRMSCTPRSTSSNQLQPNSNRRYLILTYTVEFDRIHYPLPMEYSGPPDPQILQAVIRRLESEVNRLQEQLRKPSVEFNKGTAGHIQQLEKRVELLTVENRSLTNEIKHLNKASSKGVSHRHNELHKSLKYLEETVYRERSTFHKLVERLRIEKQELLNQVQDLQRSESSLQKRLGIITRSNPVNGTQRDRSRSRTTRPFETSLDEVKHNVTPRDRRSRSHPEIIVSPRWDAKGEVQASLDKMKANLMKSSTDGTIIKNKSPTRRLAQSVEYLYQDEKFIRHRSSSGSSFRSRNHSTVIPKVKHPYQYETKTRGGRHASPSPHLSVTGDARERGRTRLLRDYCSSSASSARSSVPHSLTREQCNKSRPRSITSMASSKSSCSRHSNPRYTSLASDQKVNVHPKPKKDRHKKDVKVKKSMGDLETRIKALQKLLKDGKPL